MSKKIYKVRDKVSGKFWNGSKRCSSFGATDKTWKSQKAAEHDIGNFLRWRLSWARNSLNHSLPDNWEVVEFEVQETERSAFDIAKMINEIKVRHEANKVNPRFGYFMDAMIKRGVADQIQFAFILKPSEGAHSVDKERIKEARTHMRQLGVKTRSFREANGIFGMMDRDQALKARLVLDVNSYVDLSEIRKNLGI